MVNIDFSKPLFSLTVAEYVELQKKIQSDALQKGVAAEPKDDLYDMDGASQYLGLSKATLYTFNSLKKVPSLKVTGKVFYRRSALDAWLASGERKTNAQLRREAMEGGAK
jgi:predicted DNA-binding transcriptional regulator AlpA